MAAVCDCGTPWTFLVLFFFFIEILFALVVPEDSLRKVCNSFQVAANVSAK